MKAIYVLMLGLLSATPAHAIMHLALVGGVNTTEYTNKGGTVFGSDGQGYAAGVLLSGGLGRTVLETGALYGHHKVQNTGVYTGSIFITKFDATVVTIPLMLRRYFLHFFSIAGGGYYAHVNKITSAVLQDGAVVYAAPVTISGSSDYGLVAGLGVRLPIGILTSIILDANYYYGLASTKTLESQLLAGLSFGF